jgi:hypothetical protein
MQHGYARTSQAAASRPPKSFRQLASSDSGTAWRALLLIWPNPDWLVSPSVFFNSGTLRPAVVHFRHGRNNFPVSRNEDLRRRLRA